ncbi:MAG: hypothetical protein ACKVRO_02560 [Micropepsaceae bacterium]
MLLVTAEIADLLDGAKVSSGFPDTIADVVVGKFLAGQSVTASTRWLSLPKAYRKRFEKNLEFERLDDLDEIWAVCFRKPKPGWRFFGRFLERNVFAAIAAHDRHDLAPEAKYAERAQAAIAKWNELGLPDPHRGTKVGDYLDGVYFDVDEQYDAETST